MKNNVLNHFAFNDLKLHKRETIITMITVLIVSMIIMIFSFLSPLFTNEEYLNYLKDTGTYTHSFYTYQDEFQTLLPFEDFKKQTMIADGEKKSLQDFNYCVSYSCGSTIYNDGIFEIEGDSSMIALHLIEGRMPKNNQEIVVKKSLLAKWGYEQRTNQTIHLIYRTADDSSLTVKVYKVVGILDETGMHSLVVSNWKRGNNYRVFIQTDAQTLTLDESLGIDMGLYKALTADEFMNATSSAMILTAIQLFVIVVAIVILYGLSASSFEKKQKDYTLLRSIGITQRQMYYIILLQTLFLSLISILISVVFVFLLSIILPHIMTLPIELPFSFSSMMWNSCLIFIIVFMSYFIPAHSITRRSLTGTFEGQEFQYFYYRYKKLHPMRPFYLAWRQLVSSKKKMVMKILMICVIGVTVMDMIGYGILSYQSTNQVIELQKKVELKIDVNNHKVSYQQFLEDFQEIIEHADNALYVQYLAESTLLNRYTGSNNQSYIQPPEIYCMDSVNDDYYGLTQPQPHQVIVSVNYLNDHKISAKIHDKITFFNQEYEIIEIADLENNLSKYAPVIIMNEEDFQKLDKNDSQQQMLIRFSSIHDATNTMIQHADKLEKISQNGHYQMYLSNNNVGSQPFVYTSLSSTTLLRLLMIACISIIYIYQFSFELFKQKEDIGSYQLLGLTHREIKSIYFYKSMMIALIGFLLAAGYYECDVYMKFVALPQQEIIMSFQTNMIVFLVSLLIIVIIVVLSLIPLHYILKNDAFENKNVRE